MVQVDPDIFKAALPEWDGYCQRDALSAGFHTRQESGLCCEIAQEEAVRLRKHIWVDGSLRDGSWYVKVFQAIRSLHPTYRIAIFHVVVELSEVFGRALRRAEATGRHVPASEIQDSLDRVPKAVDLLAPHAHFVATIDNTGDTPTLQSWIDNGSDVLPSQRSNPLLKPLTLARRLKARQSSVARRSSEFEVRPSTMSGRSAGWTRASESSCSATSGTGEPSTEPLSPRRALGSIVENGSLHQDPRAEGAATTPPLPPQPGHASPAELQELSALHAVWYELTRRFEFVRPGLGLKLPLGFQRWTSNYDGGGQPAGKGRASSLTRGSTAPALAPVAAPEATQARRLGALPPSLVSHASAPIGTLELVREVLQHVKASSGAAVGEAAIDEAGVGPVAAAEADSSAQASGGSPPRLKASHSALGELAKQYSGAQPPLSPDAASPLAAPATPLAAPSSNAVASPEDEPPSFLSSISSLGTSLKDLFLGVGEQTTIVKVDLADEPIPAPIGAPAGAQ